MTSVDVGAPTRRDWAALAVLAAGLGMIVLDGTIVGVALPAVIADLSLDIADAQWVNSLYAVVLGALLLTSGRMADRWGRRRLFLGGLIVFIGGSMAAAVSHSASDLIASRAIQAVGAAAIMPATLSTVNATFRGRHRAAAFGVWGAVISGAAAIGPLTGGVLTQYLSWPWIFWVNIPLGCVVFVAALLTVRETRSREIGSGSDLIGAVLSALGLGAIVFAVIEGPDLGWWHPNEESHLGPITWPASASLSAVPVIGACGLLLVIAFIVWERRRMRRHRLPLLDLGLFRHPTFTWGNVAAGSIALGEFAIMFVLPLYLVNVLGLSLVQTGWVLAAMAIGAFASGAAARHVAARIGSSGAVLLGLAAELAGLVVIVLVLSASTATWLIAAPLVLYGLGLGLASAQLTGLVLRDVPPAQSGQASATQSTVRQLGTAMGTALAGAVLSTTLRATLPSALSAAGFTGPAVDKLTDVTRVSAGSTISMLRAQGDASPFGVETDKVVAALAHGFSDGTRASMGVAALFLVAGVLAATRVHRAAGRSPGSSRPATDRAAP